jgi:pilus assembly protein Flp/PilA
LKIQLNWNLGVYATLDGLPYKYGVEPGTPPEEANLKRSFLRFLADEKGATAIEYGLIAAGIAIAIITAVNGVGTQLSTNFNNISTSLK